LLDTNLLVRITNSADPQCAISRSAIQKLRTHHEQIVIVPQNLYEFWAVATRSPGAPPAGQNGLGMTPSRRATDSGSFSDDSRFSPIEMNSLGAGMISLGDLQ